MYICVCTHIIIYNVTGSTGLCWLLKSKIIEGIIKLIIINMNFIEIYRRNNKAYIIIIIIVNINFVYVQ